MDINKIIYAIIEALNRRIDIITHPSVLKALTKTKWLHVQHLHFNFFLLFFSITLTIANGNESGDAIQLILALQLPLICLVGDTDALE